MKHELIDIKGELSRAFPDQAWFINLHGEVLNVISAGDQSWRVDADQICMSGPGFGMSWEFDEIEQIPAVMRKMIKAAALVNAQECEVSA